MGAERDRDTAGGRLWTVGTGRGCPGHEEQMGTGREPREQPGQPLLPR